jgi:hypothetical protein
MRSQPTGFDDGQSDAAVFLGQLVRNIAGDNSIRIRAAHYVSSARTLFVAVSCTSSVPRAPMYVNTRILLNI